MFKNPILFQFVSLRLLKVTCAIVGKSSVFHCTLSEVNIDASVVHNTRSLLVSAGLGSLSAKLLRQAAPKPSLTHVAASLLAEATLIANTPLTLQVSYIFTVHSEYDHNAEYVRGSALQGNTKVYLP